MWHGPSSTKHVLKSRLFFLAIQGFFPDADDRKLQKDRLPSQNNTVGDDKLRMITETG